MSQLFVKEIHIEKVRHLSDIVIPVQEDASGFKHVIFTGKNGSGKTSLLDAIAGYIDAVTKGDCPSKLEKRLSQSRDNFERARQRYDSHPPYETEKNIAYWEERLDSAKCGLNLSFNVAEEDVQKLYEEGSCIFAYFKAQRAFSAVEPRQIEKVEFKDRYGIYESPRDLFIKYMLDLKMTQALASSNGKQEKADEIQRWFDGVRDILREIYDDSSLTIEFDEETFRFSIREQGREPFDFNSASDGFSAVLDIIIGLMLRMRGRDGRSLKCDVAGIVLIDEIENHLHLSLQKRIVPYLAQLFPNVQFIVSTHSPFVISSVQNAVIFDLEHRVPIENGLSDSTYESIVEGYFGVDSLSEELRGKYDRYKELAGKDSLEDADLIEMAELEMYLDEIPDYLALDITTEYQKLRLQMRTKGLA